MFIALTGGIGCGKSRVLTEFARCGFQTFDADKLCHDFYATEAGRAAVMARWGEAIRGEDGMPDRKRLSGIVFRNPEELAYLEKLIFPYLLQRLEALRRKYAAAPVMVEIPLLYEKELAAHFDAVIAVWSDFAVRRRRLAARGWDHFECSRRERLQWPPERKLAAGDYGIINQGNLELLAGQCRRIAAKLLYIGNETIKQSSEKGEIHE